MMTRVFKSGNSMALRIPKEFGPSEGPMLIEKEGDKWIVSPQKLDEWPKGFFKKIHIDDPNFTRPNQGEHRDILF